MKIFVVCSILIGFIATTAHTQPHVSPQKEITLSYIQQHYSDTSYTNKTMDSTFLWQIRGAMLYYPKLSHTHIKFRLKDTPIPLTARPRIWAILQRPKHRKYLITISTKTHPRFEPLLLKNLSFNAQIGVIGHEMSHIADFQQRRGLYFIELAFMHISKKYMDNFENKTDRRCIQYGLGYQLLSWSEEVRKGLKIEHWEGINGDGKATRERYMSPEWECLLNCVCKKVRH